ncbi:NADH-quinone oxidoreductase subunit NuoN [Pseudogemmobacter faecipullorum]|uniref:NADH-quinone oxidoreductase subunit N n=1 Tax=Pseudogemmobacter faecipullorum TaxID=2755041 RepID=A0ABS8CK95_9RHOB|nr:NADH-quinone oxidoreductase subunit NuoN [Pseudogemmobacter faecipullorum]MCB5409822.1 NADH-quinone oxidoreductase subunit NuoN [Pseudogemmobacter faecipullorum]
MTAVDFNIVLPEVILALYAMAALMFGVYTSKDKVAVPLVWATAGVFVALALWIGIAGEGARPAFGGMFIDDPFARFTKVLILLSAAAAMVVGQDYMSRWNMLRFEYPVILSLAVLGMMMMVSAGDLMALYLGLELQSLALYVTAAMRRDSARSSEAGLKYFVLGSLSSGMLLFGASLVYGFAGTTLFSGILTTMSGEIPLGLLFGLIFMLAGLAFKISAAPFHMWTPDVYEGSPTPVTAFFATAPKVAAMALIARLVWDAFGAIPMQWGQVLAAFAVASVYLGSVAAIGQKDIKRLMAYSSIAHMGYALIGLAAATTGNAEVAAQGVQAMLLYMAIYVTTGIGAFAFILSMERDGRPVTDIASLKMISKTEPLKALGLLMVFFSLAGVPPFIGFFAKLAVLKSAVDAGMVWLALAGAVASVIGAFYYLRVVYFVYFGDSESPAQIRMSPVQWVIFVAAAAVMLLGAINLFGIEGPALTAAQALVR